MHKAKNSIFPAEFAGDSVYARPYDASDAAAFLDMQIESRPHLLRWLGGAEDVRSLPAALEAVQHRRAAWDRREDLTVAVFDKETRRLLGESGLGPNWESRVYELGFWLRPSAQGQGYMIETNQLMCRWAFTGLAARRVVMSCDATNRRSAAVAERLGMRQFKAEYLPQESRTLLSYEMTPATYAALPWCEDL